MASDERIEQLKQYVEDWKTALDAVTQIRERLCQDREKGLSLLDEKGNDLLPDRINETDAAVRQHDECLKRMTALRDRAISGEDV